MAERIILPIVFLLFSASCSVAPRSMHCSDIQLTGQWSANLKADSFQYVVAGTIVIAGQSGKTSLVGTSEEGTEEPIDYDLSSLTASRDSIHIVFAPIGFALAGTCPSKDSLTGSFRVPHPPFPDIHGTWIMRRTP